MGLERSIAAVDAEYEDGFGLGLESGNGSMMGLDPGREALVGFEPAARGTVAVGVRVDGVANGTAAALLDRALVDRPATAVDHDAIRALFEAPPETDWRRETLYRRCLVLADAIAVLATLLIATRLAGGNHELARVATTIGGLGLMIVMGKVTGLYDRQDLLIRKSTLDEAPQLFQLATLYAVIFWVINGQFVTGFEDRRGLLMLWITLFPSLLVFRALARRLSRLATPPERCMVIGGFSACERIRAKFATTSGLHAKVIACVRLDAFTDETRAVKVLSHSFDLRALAIKYRVDRFIIAPERADADEVMNLTRAATAVGVKVSLVPRILEVMGSAAEFDEIESIPLLTIRRAELSWSSQLLKRGLDVIVSVSGLVVLAPIWAVVAIAIKLDSSGPVLFRQHRIGRDGKSFEMMKFRTMVDGAHARRGELLHLNEAVGLFKIARDPRITRIGGILRRLSLDEMPQLWNVVRGDMSLVGPRPLIPEEDQYIQGWARRRLQLTLGMTGHWQILGSARIPLHEMAKIDYLYVTGWSLWNDIKILLRTIPYVAARQGM